MTPGDLGMVYGHFSGHTKLTMMQVSETQSILIHGLCLL